MDFKDIYQIKDEIEQIQKTYELFNEDARLNRSKAAKVEFITNVRYIEKYLTAGCRILDIGAGAGEYSFYFARRGFEVCALELTDANIKSFRSKLKEDDKIELTQGNAVDLSMYEDESFDIVLLFGPLYHLHSDKDRQKCISEAKRVCKRDGVIFFSFIGNDMVILTELDYDNEYLRGSSYDHDTFKVEDFPFVFFTVDSCRNMLLDGGIKIMHEVASDGISELMEDRINTLDDESYAQYLRYHEYICEKPEFLGMSNHLLFVGR
ncbi:MAG: class I SAM-dependent methyltransferase [Ruminococcaceae bacterium]|nr:class I SAM-dependent methyltransferase [Oscillospiraceae bacterium]